MIFATIASAQQIAPAVVDDDERSRIVEFEKHYDSYFRMFFGCQPNPTPTTRETCGVNPHPDAREKRLAREAAKKLFDLAEPRK